MVRRRETQGFTSIYRHWAYPGPGPRWPASTECLQRRGSTCGLPLTFSAYDSGLIASGSSTDEVTRAAPRLAGRNSRLLRKISAPDP